MNSEIYEVKKCAGVPGLLVTNHVYPPGQKFTKDEWKWSDETLAAALKNGRCVKVEPEKEEVKSEKEPEPQKELTEDDKLKILEGMMKEYENLPEDSRKAKTLLRKIKELEAEIK